MITIWGTCRPFKGNHVIIQRNSIKSWRELSDDVLLLGKEKGLADIAAEFDCVHIPDVHYNKWGTPFLVSLFETARKHARYELMCSVCCDMILLQDFMEAAKIITMKFHRFLMIGLKWHVPNIPSFYSWDELRKWALLNGKPHKKTGGSDYFVYPKGLFADVEFPKVLVRGRYRDDIWLITTTLERGIPVVDVTDVVMAVHQPHRKYPRDGPEVKANVKYTRHLKKKAVKDATWKLTERGLVKC